VTEKQRALDAVQRLPEDANVEDAIERLCFIAKVQKGIRELDAGQGVSHEDATRGLSVAEIVWSPPSDRGC